MNREGILKGLIKEKGMNLKEFSEIINIPYTTLHSMLKRGIGNASVDNVIKICRGLAITVDELEEMAEIGKIIETNKLSESEREIIKLFRSLSNESKMKAKWKLEGYAEALKEEEAKNRKKMLPN